MFGGFIVLNNYKKKGLQCGKNLKKMDAVTSFLADKHPCSKLSERAVRYIFLERYLKKSQVYPIQEKKIHIEKRS